MFFGKSLMMKGFNPGTTHIYIVYWNSYVRSKKHIEPLGPNILNCQSKKHIEPLGPNTLNCQRSCLLADLYVLIFEFVIAGDAGGGLGARAGGAKEPYKEPCKSALQKSPTKGLANDEARKAANEP